ncbi:nicotinate-nucleotide--dimethylbenzimidazole phosphoribosyltransferase [Streptomyces sp. NPDC005496]|uniref:nicotinate-nucleotide--dimethylbenzimidazole phosphoribosyltransferase n=1 Tax=Streptomyces sp. NPDC005496 TaxID=3364716 RepID=UPI0036CB2302
MTDTGQVPGEGLPENAGMVEQPGASAHGAYTFLDPSETPAEDDDLLLMPGAQGAWGNEVPPPPPLPLALEPGPVPGQEPGPQLVHEPGPHETDGRDSGSVDLGAVRMAQPPAPAPQPTTPRRPLHLGPPIPDGSSSPVRSLADRGPAGAPTGPAPLRQAGPPTIGPEYLDVPQAAEVPQQGAPWGAAPQPQDVPPVPQASAGGTAAETVVPEAAPTAVAEAPEAPEPAEAPAQAADVPVEPETAFEQPAEAAQPAETPDASEAAPGEFQAPEAVDVPAPDTADAVPAPEAQPSADAAHAPEGYLHQQALDTALDRHAVLGSPEPYAPADPAAPQDPAAPVAPQAPEGPEDAHTGQTAFDAVRPEEHLPQPPAHPEGVEPSVPVDDVHPAASADQPAPAEVAQPAPVQDSGAHLYAAPDPQSGEPELHQTPTQTADPVAFEADAATGLPEAAAAFAPVVEPQQQPAEAPQPSEAETAPVAEEPLADAAPGFVAPDPETAHVQQFSGLAAEPQRGVPAVVGAQAAAPHAVLGQTQAARSQGEVLPEEAAGSPEPAPVETPREQRAGRHAHRSVGEFVPVDGSVPTTPHLAPTPPHAMAVPPLPPQEEQPQQAAPAAEPEATAPVQVPAEEPEPVHPPVAEAVPESAAEPVAEPGPVTGLPTDAEPVAAVPAPREAEAPPAPPAPEPPAADPEPVVAQQADDLDTQGADQEESTAAVEDVRESTGPAAPGYDDAEREAVLRVMRERRDIRNGFRSDPIPHDVLLRVLEAAHTAPSVGHSQPWDFVVIRSAETRRSMHELAARQREAYAKSLPKGRAKQFKELKIEAILDTPVNIVVTADPTRGGRHTLGRHTQPQMAPYSSALAVENLWLAARAEGLGVGWVSFFDEREMVRALGLPEHLEVVAYLCVGYVDEFPDEPELMQAGWSKRRPLSWVVHEETYGRRALPGEEPHDLLAETVTNIRPLDAKALGEAWERQKRMTKPAGALGMLEIISAQLSGLSRQCPPPIPEPAAVAIFAGDHGVHAQGVTPWPQEVTAQMVANFLGGGAVCNAFANQVGAEVCVIDVGVASDLPATPGLLPRKIRAGTSDMTTGPAMTREEARAAIEVGIETARDLVAAGNKALLTGEMGIANTTASAALISVFTGTDPSEVTGRGTGINDETLARKTEVVRRALDVHQPDPADPIGVLAAIGGFEHAAMVGLLLGGASLRTPVILDGVSAGAAALVARAIAPEVLAACIAGHRSAEPGHVAALNKLGLRPLVDLDLRLGEGTGALLALPVVQSAARAMHEVATFDSAGVTEK